MSLSSAWNVASSSLTTNSALTSVVSRNISGAQNASGYYSTKVGNVVTGPNGATIVASITDTTNNTLFNAMLSSTSANSSAQALSDGLTQLQQTVTDSTSSSSTTSTSSATSPSALISNLQTALQTYSAAPSNSGAAQAVISSAQALATGLNNATATVQQTRETADQNIATDVGDVNSLLSQFQQVNNQIVTGTASGADLSDALDQRSTILQSLSKDIGITTTTSPNGGMQIYTDSGVTLFNTIPADVTFSPTTTYTAGVPGNAVYVNGQPITGAGAIMPIQSGAIAGLAQLRDQTATQYQSQLDEIAGSLVNAFGETGQTAATSSTTLPGLFTYAGATSVPGSTLVSGLAGQIDVNAAIDPSQGGNISLLQNGGVNGAAYVYNTTGAAGYTDRIQSLISGLSSNQSFDPSGGISGQQGVTSYASASVSWLDAAYQSASSNATYQSTLSSQASQALSNATGVNIDSQMSKMLELENSYQASAKMIATINTMFGNLLQAVM